MPLVQTQDCSCDEGYSGNGEDCFTINECTLDIHNCHDNATCTDTDGSFDCATINECTLGTQNCHDNATCTDTDGSFDCSCDEGYSENGEDCSTIN